MIIWKDVQKLSWAVHDGPQREDHERPDIQSQEKQQQWRGYVWPTCRGYVQDKATQWTDLRNVPQVYFTIVIIISK